MARGRSTLEWRTFFKACIRKRVTVEKFTRLLQAFDVERSSSDSRIIVETLLEAGKWKNIVDPRLQGYLEVLIDANRTSIVTLFIAVQPSEFDKDKIHDATLLDTGDSALSSLQACVLQLLIKKIAGGIVSTDVELLQFLKASLPWTARLPASLTLALLFSTTLGSRVAQDVLPGARTRKFKAALGRSLTPLIQNLSQVNMQLAGTLQYWQKHYHLQDEIIADSMDLFNNVDLGTLSFQENVLDNEPTCTRSGLYIYLNANLCHRPLADDPAVMNYLNQRYKGNIASLVTDLILASFDVLANAIYRTEPSQTITVLRSFLVNKLPAFLEKYAAFLFPPITIESCISQALLRVDPAAFPSFSQMFDPLGKNAVLSEARQEFLFACALHDLIPESNIENLLGDVPMQSLPASGRYVRNDLVSQCTTNPSKIEELIGELENMEGNAGEIAGALVEIITTLCGNNDTLTLKGICNCLVRRSATMDIICLFCLPQTLLQLLCQLLDNWQEHEDQGEHQPVYEEFGSVLLLIATIRHRFSLEVEDLAFLDQDSFMTRYFDSASISRRIEDMTGHQNDLLGDWIRGLFETEGINDELMSICKPAEFHLLAATLFDQSIKACQTGVLSLETLKGGFEYFLSPFLLPALPATLIYFSNRLWESNSSPSSTSLLTNILLPALQTLLKPSTSDSAVVFMHSAVLKIAAESLSHSLAHVQRLNNNKHEKTVSGLLEALKPHMTHHRAKAAAYSELETWAQTPRQGFLSALSAMVGGLMRWNVQSTSAVEMPRPPNYSHKLLLQAIEILGAKPVMRTLVDEVLGVQMAGGEVDMVMDNVVTMVVAPLPASGGRLGLRHVLRTQLADVNEMAKTEPEKATVLVRLGRRVEAFAAGNGGGGGGGGGDGDAAATAAAHAAEDVIGLGNEHMGDAGVMDMDLGIGALGTGQTPADIDDVLAKTEGQFSGEFLGNEPFLM